MEEGGAEGEWVEVEAQRQHGAVEEEEDDVEEEEGASQGVEMGKAERFGDGVPACQTRVNCCPFRME